MTEENLYKIDWLTFDIEPITISRLTNSIVVKINGRQNRYEIKSNNNSYIVAQQPFIAATFPNVIVVVSKQRTLVHYAKLTIKIPSELGYYGGDAYVNEIINNLKDDYPIGTVYRNSKYQNIFWFIVKADVSHSEVSVTPPKRQISISPESYKENLFRVAIFAWRERKPPIAAAFISDRRYSFFNSSFPAIQSASPVVAFNNWRNVNCAEIDYFTVQVKDDNVYAVKYPWLLNNIGYLETNLPEEEWAHIERALNLE